MSDTATLLTTEIRSLGLREAWGEQLITLGHQFPQLVVLDGDLANSTKADLFAAAVPDRFFEMGIAEQNMLGVAAGLATTGYVPWISTFAAFGWNVVESDGHDHLALADAFDEAIAYQDGPTVIVANTVKGEGVSFMENDFNWHATPPNAQQLADAIAEINGGRS